MLCGFQYVKDACHKTVILPLPKTSRIPDPRQHIHRLSRRHWLLGSSFPFGLAAGCLLHCWRASNGLLRSECPLFRDRRMVLYARASFEWLLHTNVLCSLRLYPFGSCLSAKFGKFCMTTLQPHLHSSLSIATCLGRWRLMASRLSPFLPASDPRLPVARQGKVLSLHHLEGKVFTYMNTQLSRYNDLAAHPLYLAIQFRANGSHTMDYSRPMDNSGGARAAQKQRTNLSS